ncbi:hypothetical protein ABB37_06661 [Leptomonas pyrrhocoris]|uniref:Peptidyl-prolyl cis-trans isomerase n=1 Tax=Leptomonas pyrrhocoris TaxID=157538 RepID=A0A0M9FXB5_LEPPY|nr:hypothetical protein ABB37_06661 [Leptomonas pyrrhocoris]KPA77859.1 hypothetical protein ABB37_06661 [Leptomonas pyrrhocoris]|eukprot:XP_015656298.1 hypothetical protein ABB37_06661 [Leptomonas pyrrhocoris]
MQRDDGAAPIVATAGLLLETSLGSLVIDIIGADCPALSANFLNLCRAEFWNGAVATEVVPDVAIFFSLTADPVYYDHLRSALEHPRPPSSAAHNAPSGGARRLVQSFWSLLPRQAADPTAVQCDPTSSLASVRQTLPGTAARSATASASSVNDPVEQQDDALQLAIQHEVRLCKRRRCVGLSLSHAGNKKNENNSAHHADVYQPLFAAAASSGATSPCAVCGAGRLLIDITAPTLRFGLTLTNRTMDFLDSQYVVIGHVREGEAVLQRMRRTPLSTGVATTTSHAPPSTASAAGVSTTQEADGDDAVVVVAGRPAAAWPRPVRIVRIKRARVLPTAGTDRYISSPSAAWSGLSAAGNAAGTAAETHQRRQRVGQALQQAGCFAYWASAAAVRAAHRRLVGIVQACLAQEGYSAATRPTTVAAATALLRSDSSGSAGGPRSSSPSKPFVVLQRSNSVSVKTPLDANDEADSLELTYNPHYAGAYLSSEEEDDVYDDTLRGTNAPFANTRSLSAKQLEERRRLFMQQHQEKANETLSLMLNVLNGVADPRGDMRPPENVLFVCKLNPVTTGEGLEMCFAQFGRVVSAEVIYDATTKQSLCYGFVEFETVEACFRAFQKMEKALIDDCRIHVDFSQSVSKLWAQRQRELRKRPRPEER